MKEKSSAALQAAYQIESDGIRSAFSALDPQEAARAVAALEKAARIGACGCGHSGIACQHFAHLMCCIDRPARFLYPSEAAHGGLGFLQKGDVMLFVSRGGKTQELLPLEQICRRRGVTVLAVTAAPDSELARNADIVLQISVTRETDRSNCQGTTSFVVTCALFDALQAALIEETDFRTDEFAVIHPGGAVGQRLCPRADTSQ